MIQVIKCPSCAAPLQIDGDDFERCDFCGSRILVSPQNTVSPDSFDFGGLLTQAHKLKEILHLARSGRKIEAIKIYRDTFGSGLAEAKEAVENLVDGKPLNFTNFQMFSVNSLRSNKTSPSDQMSDLREVQAELQRGNKINAIKIYREKFGVGLKEAKDAVDNLERTGGVGFRSYKSNVKISKTAKAIGWATTFFILLGVLGGLAGAGVAIFAVYQTTKSALPVPAPITNSKTSQNGKTAYATEILRSGGEGVGGGLFKDNRLIATDGEGRVYSVNYNGGLLQQFDGSGKFLAQWNVGEKTSLQDLIADKKNLIYVLSFTKLEIYDGSTQQLLNRVERANYKSLALDANDKLYAITNNNQFVKLNESGKIIGDGVSLSKQLNDESFNLKGLTIDGAGNFYVFDSDKNYVLKFSPEAKLLLRFDNPPNKNRKLNFIHDLAVDKKGRIFVAETNEIHAYDNDGRYLNSFETRQSLGITFDEQNNLWTASRPFIVKYQLNQ